MAEQTRISDPATVIDGKRQAVEFALSYIQQAQRELCFFGPDLNKALFDHPQMIEQLSLLARHSQYSRLRFVIHSSRQNSADTHRLLPLAQKLSSKILIHQCARDDLARADCFLLTDAEGYLHCQNSVRFTGSASLTDRVGHARLKQQFESIWARSTPDPNARRLNL